MDTLIPPGQADWRHLLQVALRYADHGWPVLPVHTPRVSGCSCPAVDCGSPGKHPRTARGVHDASTDPDRIRTWWQRWPDANVAVATGKASGLMVLDVDLPDGPASLARLVADRGPLPATCEQRTGSGGRQLLFAHPGEPVGNRARLQPGIDVRADGGYIVVPPSAHPSGHRYRWLGRTPPADPPGWLMGLLADRARTPEAAAVEVPAALPPPAGSREQRYAASALHGELTRVASAVVGSRNDMLNRAAFNLGQLTAAGLLDRDHVAGELERVATGIGLGPAETRRNHHFRAGRRPPAPPHPSPRRAVGQIRLRARPAHRRPLTRPGARSCPPPRPVSRSVGPPPRTPWNASCAASSTPASTASGSGACRCFTATPPLTPCGSWASSPTGPTPPASSRPIGPGSSWAARSAKANAASWSGIPSPTGWIPRPASGSAPRNPRPTRPGCDAVSPSVSATSSTCPPPTASRCPSSPAPPPTTRRPSLPITSRATAAIIGSRSRPASCPTAWPATTSPRPTASSSTPAPAPGERLATLAHELAHREDPKLIAAHVAGDRGYYAHNRPDCEAVAEAAAHTISARFGHDITGHSAGYITGWIRGDVDRFKQLHERVGQVTRQLVPPDHRHPGAGKSTLLRYLILDLLGDEPAWTTVAERWAAVARLAAFPLLHPAGRRPDWERRIRRQSGTGAGHRGCRCSRV